MRTTLPPNISTGRCRHLYAALTVLASFAGLFFPTTGNSQVLYQYTNASSGAYNTIADPVNMSATGLQRGSGVSGASLHCTGATQGFGSDGWPSTNAFDTAVFHAAGDYIQFSMTANSGYGFKLTGFSAKMRRENPSGTAGDGPATSRYSYSKDNGATWTFVNPGNPQSSSNCSNIGVLRTWPSFAMDNATGTVIFRIYGLSSGTNNGPGDLFLRDVIVNGYICSSEPEVTVEPTLPAVCSGVSSDYLYFSASGGATTYTIDYDAIAEGEGFMDVTSRNNLPVDSILLTIPALATPGAYNGTFTVYNECGFSASVPFTVTIHSLPTVVLSGDDTICEGEQTALNADVTGTAPWTLTLTGPLVYGPTMADPFFPVVFPNDTTTFYPIALTDGNGCSALPAGLTGSAVVNVVPTPELGFTASSTGGSSDSGNTGLGNDTLYIDLCEGDSLDISDLDISDNSGIILAFTADVSVTYDGDPIGPELCAPADIAPSEISGFFGDPCGPFGLNDVNAGTVTLTFVPYHDLDESGDYSEGDCIGDTLTLVMTIHDTPVMDVVDDITVCKGDVVEVGFTSNYIDAVYDWTSTQHGTGIGASGTGAIVFTATNTGTTPLKDTVYVTPEAEGCTGRPVRFIITVNPMPMVDATADINVCSGGTVSETVFSGPVPGTLYSWTRSGAFIGLAASSGTGSVPSFTAITNNTPVAITDTFIVTTSFTNGTTCTGSSDTFTITVQPELNLSIIRLNGQNICSGDMLHYEISTTVDSPGILFDLRLIESPVGGFPADLTDNHPGIDTGIVFSNRSASSADADTLWYQLFNDLGIFDAGRVELRAFNIRLADAPECTMPDVNATTQRTRVYADPRLTEVPDTTICSGVNPGLGSFTIEGWPSGTTEGYPVRVEWSAMASSMDVSGYTSGLDTIYDASGNLLPSAINNTLVNSCNQPETVTYKIVARSAGPNVTFNANDCYGDTMEVVVTINPIPVVDEVNDITVCNDDPVSEIVFTGNVAGAVYNWVQDEQSDNIGSDDAGSGSIPAFTAINTGNEPLTATYTVTPSYTNNDVTCEGEPYSFNITVNPTPTVDDVMDITVCVDAYVSTITFTGNVPGTVYSWEHSGDEIGSDLSGNDYIPSFTATNGGTTVLTATYTVTPTYSDDAVTCTGEPITFTITVNPALPQNSAVMGEDTIYVNTTTTLTPTIIPAPGVTITYGWTSNDPMIASVDNDGLVTGLIPGSTTIFYTATDNGGCIATSTLHPMTVLPGVVLDLVASEESPVTCGDTVMFTVRAQTFVDLASLQFTLSWDNADFSFVTNSDLETIYPIKGIDPITGNVGSDMVYSWYDFIDPLGATLPNNSVLLRFKLRVLGSSGMENILFTNNFLSLEALSSDAENVVVTGDGTTIEFAPLTVEIGPNPVICPDENTTILLFENLSGSADQYMIDFDGDAEVAGFEDITGTLDLESGFISIVVPGGLNSGVYNACVKVNNTSSGCQSECYPFAIVTDTVPPVASAPADVTLDCIADIPDYDTESVIASDNCDEELEISFGGDTDNEGSGCNNDPLVIIRTYTVTDDAGNETQVTQMITVKDDILPVTGGQLAPWYGSYAEAEQAALDTARAYATDNCTPPILIDVYLCFNETKPVERTIETCEYTFYVCLEDACGNVASYTYTTVIDEENPVATAGIVDDCYEVCELCEDGVYGYAIQDALDATTGTDDCTSPFDLTKYAYVTGDKCELFIHVVVEDACGKSDTVTYVTRVESDAPVFEDPNPQALSGLCFDDEASAIAYATSITVAGDDCTGPELLIVDGYVEGECPATVIITVTDFCGNIASIAYENVIIDSIAPEVNDYSLENDCFQHIDSAIAAILNTIEYSDNCTPWEELIVSTDTTIISGENDACEIVEVSVSVTDYCGNSTTVTYNVSVDNRAPSADELDPLDPVACLEDVPEPNTELLTGISDNCTAPEAIEVTWLEDELPENCPGNIIRRYQLEDCAGNTSIVEQLIPYSNESAPEWNEVSTALDRTINCNDDETLVIALGLAPTATDDCPNEEPLISGPTESVSEGCGLARVITRTWTVTDACGNQGLSFVQTITIVDNNDPYWLSVPDDITVQCGDTTGLEEALAFAPAAADSCATALDTTRTLVWEPSLGCGEGPVGRYVITWTLSDGCGNQGPDFVQYIYVIDNTPPEWVTEPGELDQSIECDDELAFYSILMEAPVATDACSDAAVYLYDWYYVPGENCAQEGDVYVYWYAMDSCGNYSDPYIQIISLIDNTGPDWITPAGSLDTLLSCEDVAGLMTALNQAPQASDNCQEGANIELIESSFEAGNCPGTGTYIRTFIATDDCGNASTAFTQIVTVVDTTDPGVMAGSIAACYSTAQDAQDAAIAATYASDNCTTEGLSLTAEVMGTCTATVVVTVTDLCGNSTQVSYSTRIDNQGPTITPDLTINGACFSSIAALENAIQIRTTVQDDCPGSLSELTITTTGTCPATSVISIVDGCGNSASYTYTGMCIDDTPPVLLELAEDLTVECNGNGNTTDLNNWLNNHGGAIANGPVTWTHNYGGGNVLSDGCGATGSVSVLFTATDACGNSVSTSANFVIYDTQAPVFSTTASDVTVECDGSGNAGQLTAWLNNNGGAVAQDVCSGVTWSHNYGGMNVLSNGCGATGSVTVTFTAMDACGNSNATVASFIIVDTQAPTFNAPGNITIYVDTLCNYDATPAATGNVSNASDGCSAILSASYTDNVVPGTGQTKAVITRTWRVTDECGNTSQPLNQVITVLDTTPPTLTCPTNITVAGTLLDGGLCGIILPLNNVEPKADDNCDPYSLTYTVSGGSTGTGTGAATSHTFLSGVNTVNYTIVDAAGYTLSCSFTVTINCYTVMGNILWEHDKTSGVNATKVRLQGTSSGMTTTGSNGKYTLLATDGTSVQVIPSKNWTPPQSNLPAFLNGVTSADATAVQKHATGLILLNDPYKVIAADVNMSNNVTTADASLITQALLGNALALTQFDTAWRFVRTTHVFPNPNNPWTTLPLPEWAQLTNMTGNVTGIDFYGIKIGDVNGTASPLVVPATTAQTLRWIVPDQELHAGETVSAMFTASQFIDLSSFQLALDFDPTQLELMTIDPLNALPEFNLGNFGTYNAENGEIRSVWSHAEGVTLQQGMPVFRIRFKVLQGGQKLSDVLTLAPEVLPCKAYNNELAEAGIQIVFDDSQLVSTQDPDMVNKPIKLLQNRPNPFVDQTTIGFILPDNCEAQLRIYDMSGRVLAEEKRAFPAGYNEVEFQLNEAQSGVLYYELVTPFGRMTRKMVQVK